MKIYDIYYKYLRSGNALYGLVSFTLMIAFVVIVLGAYTRLTDAGLGCPDWPVCYGKLIVPNSAEQIDRVQAAFPDTPLYIIKAWTEMVHRYMAMSLGLLVLGIFILSVRKRLREPLFKLRVPILLLLMVIAQALLGMWTVTLKLLPIVVMAHLLGGLTIFSLLWLLRLKLQMPAIIKSKINSPAIVGLILFGFIMVCLQIALGGWVSANYAGLACVGFPACNGILFPHLHLAKAFNIHLATDISYQYGILDSATRMTIQYVHRIWAVLTTVYLVGLSTYLIYKSQAFKLRNITVIILVLLAIQFSLGIINVTQFLPLSIAIAHNACAALLLISMVTLVFYVINSRDVSHASFQ